MKKIRYYLDKVFLLAVLFCTAQSYAQYMPVVFDKQYGTNNKAEHIVSLDEGEAAMVIKEGNNFSIVRINRTGEVIATLPLTDFTAINQLAEVDGKLLIVGQSNKSNKIGQRDVTRCGRVLLINKNGETVTSYYAGTQGSEFLTGALLRNGALILAGAEPNGTNTMGMIVKADHTGKTIYHYRYPESAYCDRFEVLGNTTEYICAVFSAKQEKQQAAAIRLDDKGKPYYISPIPSTCFKATGLSANINDGSVVFTGDSPADGGMVYKVRPEGDIVFGKMIIPSFSGATLNRLEVTPGGNILLGGSSNKGYYALLRSDGTTLHAGVADGIVAGLGMNKSTGESIITTYDAQTRRGSFVRISSGGKAEFNQTLEGNFDLVNIFNDGEALLLSSSEGRVCMYSATGNREFDRYVTENRPTEYKKALTASSGEVLFLGAGSRLVKLGHGLYVSDLKITKPVNGTVTAVFTVTLTGYATTKEGAPIPVSVEYATRELSATTQHHFIPVQGKLSFTPSRGAAERYLVRQEIEVPVKANEFVEGEKEFELCLSDVTQSYLVKPSGKAVIEDQQSLVKLVRTEKGVEGDKYVVFELGLFKTDGAPLYNKTGANIIVDGIYGQGTADALDFDMGLTPRVIFNNGQQRAMFNVKTLQDTRYELSKTVVVQFNNIHKLSGTNVTFEGEMLSCNGTITDQPARLEIASLGDHRLNNNAVSGFFTIMLKRLSDGALLTNATGNDIVVKCEVIPDASAKEGKDFVFTNIHDLRIGGDGNHSAVNVNGVVLYTPDGADKQVKLRLKAVTQPSGAEPIVIAVNEAEFTIRK